MSWHGDERVRRVRMPYNQKLAQPMPYDQPEIKMQLEAPKSVWIGSKHFNEQNICAGNITGVRTEKGKYGTDYILQIQPLESNDTIEMTVWGSNYHYLYNTHGNDATKWIGKPISIVQHMENGKPRRVVT